MKSTIFTAFTPVLLDSERNCLWEDTICSHKLDDKLVKSQVPEVKKPDYDISMYMLTIDSLVHTDGAHVVLHE